MARCHANWMGAEEKNPNVTWFLQNRPRAQGGHDSDLDDNAKELRAGSLNFKRALAACL